MQSFVNTVFIALFFSILAYCFALYTTAGSPLIGQSQRKQKKTVLLEIPRRNWNFYFSVAILAQECHLFKIAW